MCKCAMWNVRCELVFVAHFSVGFGQIAAMLIICFFVLLNIFADEAKQLFENLVWKGDGNSKLWVLYNVWGSYICTLISMTMTSYKLKEFHIFNPQSVLSNLFALLCTWEIFFFFRWLGYFQKLTLTRLVVIFSVLLRISCFSHLFQITSTYFSMHS